MYPLQSRICDIRSSIPSKNKHLLGKNFVGITKQEIFYCLGRFSFDFSLYNVTRARGSFDIIKGATAVSRLK
jgi:hypothetical protein